MDALKQYLYCILLILFPFLLSAQIDSTAIDILPPRINELCEQGEKALKVKNYEGAELLFRQALQQRPEYAPALRGWAVSLQLRGLYLEAAQQLDKLIKADPRFSRAVYFDCALNYYGAGLYGKALSYFQQYGELQQLEDQDFGYNGIHEKEAEEKYRSRLAAMIHACRYAKDSVGYMNVAAITNLGDSINSRHDEYFPFLTNSQNLLFYTRSGYFKKDEDLYFSFAQGTDWSAGQLVGTLFNTTYNEGMCTMTRDGVRMYYTACGREDVQGTCDIREALLEQNKVVQTMPLKGTSNTDDWESQASISCDGSTLYFASNRDGGYGGTDIWVSHLQADGSWSSAKNLGPIVNTTGDEEAPFITNDSETLYFSSTGHKGLGEQDVFMSRRDEQGEWDLPINLGAPVNSSYRELGFFLSADGRTGYFSSNRRGGFGGMDIYKFELSRELESRPITFVEGFVKDSITRQAVQTTLRIKDQNPVQTDAKGRFFLCLPAEEAFKFHIFETGYNFYQRTIPIPLWDNKTFYPLEILLQKFNPSPPPIPPGLRRDAAVFFDFDKDLLKSEEAKKLDAYIQNLKTHGFTNVTVTGYCDYIGSDTYNLELSERRANAVAVYLQHQGISIDKLIIEGQGEIKDTQPRWVNRRVNVRTVTGE